MIKKFKADALQKAKEEKVKAKEEKEKAKEEKEKAKEEQKKAKEEQKIKLKEEKITLKKVSCFKSKTLDDDEENVIVCGGCTEVIKTGPNKGKSCGTTVHEDGLCKRHHNLKIKKAESKPESKPEDPEPKAEDPFETLIKIFSKHI